MLEKNNEEPIQEIKNEEEKIQPVNENSNKITEKVIEIIKDIFSLRNFIISLLSALLIIGISYGSGPVGTLIQKKFIYANPTIYMVYLIITIVVYLLVIISPAFLNSVYTKKWASFIYIIILQIIWLIAFIAILYVTTETKEPPTFDFGAPTTLEEPVAEPTQ